MNSDLARLRAVAVRLAKRFEEVAAQLEEAAVAVRQGSPTTIALEQSLITAREELESLQTLVIETVPADSGEHDVSTLPAIVACLDKIEASQVSDALQNTRKRALAALDQVLALRHTSNSDFSPLQECQRSAERMRQEILDRTALEAHQDEVPLASGVHPLASLSRLVNELATVDDDTIERFDNQIRSAYGSALALAAVRGLLEARVALPVPPASPPPTPANNFSQEPRSADNRKKQEDKGDKEEGPAPPPAAAEPVTGGQDAPISSASDVAAPETATTSESPNTPPPLTHDDADTAEASLVVRVRYGDQDAVENFIWQLLAEDRVEAAYQLVSIFRRNEEEPSTNPKLLPWMVRPLLLGPKVGYPSGQIFRALGDDYSYFREEWFNRGTQDWRTSIGLLMAAGALRPSLLAPATGASTILRSLHFGPGLEQTYVLTCLLAEHAERQNPLKMAALRGSTTQASWLQAQGHLQAEVKTWLAEARPRTMIFAGATHVWKQWVSSGGVIKEILEHILNWGESRFSDASRKCEQHTGDLTTFRKLVNRTDREQVGRRRGPDISATALSQLHRGFLEASDFVRRACELATSQPGQDRDYLAQQAQDIQSKLTGLHDGVVAELSRLRSGRHVRPILGAGRHFTSALNDIVHLVCDAESPTHEPDPGELTQAVLLKATTVTLDDAWHPVESPATVREAVLKLVETPQISWEEAFERQAIKGDHAATQRIISQLGAASEDASAVERLSARREDAIDEKRAGLKRLAQSTSAKLESAVAAGVIGDADRSVLLSRIESVDRREAEHLRFHTATAELHKVQQDVQGHRHRGSEQLRSAMRNAGINKSHEAFSRIDRAITAGDTLVANEYLDYVKRGESLPEKPDAHSAFEEFFPGTLRKLTSALESANLRNPNKLAQAITRGDEIGGLRFAGDDQDSDQAARFIQGWMNAERSRDGVRETHVNAVLTHLGFSVSMVTTMRRTPRFKVFEVKTEVLSDRLVCPMPAFGSTAGGRYRVLCAFDHPNEEDLAAEIERSGEGLPTIVFYLGVLSEPRRRLLARLSRQKPRPMVVLDLALALFLAARPGGRLRTFFECSLPFNCLEPFSTTAGLVPPEMFFGRERERQSIIDPQAPVSSTAAVNWARRPCCGMSFEPFMILPMVESRSGSISDQQASALTAGLRKSGT